MTFATPLLWLLAALVAGGAAWAVGWPAWRASRARVARDLNAERYLAWRGRASRGGPPPGGLTGTERRRLYAAAVLAVVGVACLVGFFVASG